MPDLLATTQSVPEIQTRTAPASARPVVVHITVQPGGMPFGLARIWESTFLLDQHSAHASRMVGHEGITLYPEWTYFAPHRRQVFTLTFEPLPPAVRVFDLAEVIPEPRGFRCQGITRQDPDTYWLDFTQFAG